MERTSNAEALPLVPGDELTLGDPNWVERLVGRAGAWLHDRSFRGNHRRRLVYNACWEDPALDRELMGLGPESRVVMITSAGCNALDYLLDDPAEIHAVDVNPRQNALLELKQAMLAGAGHADLFQAFGLGWHPNFLDLLESLRGRMLPESHQYWERKRHYFDRWHFKRSFYFHGSSGDVAWAMRVGVLDRCPMLRKDLAALLRAVSLAEQAEAWTRIEPRLWNRFTRWLVQWPVTHSLLGVPRSQTRLITAEYPGGMLGFVRDKLRHVATALPFHDNYFWRVYVDGAYTPGCCPNYLKPGNAAVLRDRVDRVRTYTMALERFLERHPGRYSHYVLLDHQDWMAWHDPSALAREWRGILRNSVPGTRILFRSAAPRVDFLPDFVLERVRFDDARTAALHVRDRVGTYGSLYLGEVS